MALVDSDVIKELVRECPRTIAVEDEDEIAWSAWHDAWEHRFRNAEDKVYCCLKNGPHEIYEALPNITKAQFDFWQSKVGK